jgi:plastocyanin
VPVAGNAAEESKNSQPTIVPVGEDGMQRVTMVLDSYSYSPDYIVVQAGKPVELILKNGASELSVERDVSAGKTLTVQFTPMQRGVFAFYCDKKLLFFASHREKGMEGKLEVR